MKYSLIGVLALLFVLSACGGGVANTAQPSGNTVGKVPENKAPENTAPENKSDDPPKEDPYAYRKVEGTTPSGWHTLAKPGRDELFNKGILKSPDNDLEWLTGVCTPKAPGPTEGDEEWNEWREQASAALLFHAGKPGQNLVDVMKATGPNLIPDFDASTVVEDGGLGGGASADGRYVYMAFSNKLGTYVVVSVIAEGENHDKNGQAVIAWVESIKPN